MKTLVIYLVAAFLLHSNSYSQQATITLDRLFTIVEKNKSLNEEELKTPTVQRWYSSGNPDFVFYSDTIDWFNIKGNYILSLYEKNNKLDQIVWTSEAATTNLFDSLITALNKRFKENKSTNHRRVEYSSRALFIRLEYTNNNSLDILIEHRRSKK